MIGGASGIGFGLGLSIGKASNQQRKKTQVKPYIEPDVLESLCGVWSPDGKRNNGSSPNIIKNKLANRGGDFEVFNASYTTGSGYGKDDDYTVFVTDGIDDLIMSHNTVASMIGDSSELTVVSMITTFEDKDSFVNYIRENSMFLARNTVAPNGSKAHILGYRQYDIYAKQGTVVRDILGDWQDIQVAFSGIPVNYNIPFSVEGYLSAANNILECSKIAWYWTFISKKYLSGDQINQVIRYFDLDKPIKPQIYYNVEEQGLTNENHADFNDHLHDFSGSGYHIPLYNFAWNYNSGVSYVDKHYLRFDGVNDYAQITAPLELKDYTLIVDRSYDDLLKNQVPIISAKDNNVLTPFVFEYGDENNVKPFSFGSVGNEMGLLNLNHITSYQTKYRYNGKTIKAGSSTDEGSGLTIGRYGENMQYAKICLYYMLLYPYSLSDFLIRRQLERLKLTDPDEIEWRPQVSSNIPYENIRFYHSSRSAGDKLLNPGDYYRMGGEQSIRVHITPNGEDVPYGIKVNGIEKTGFSKMGSEYTIEIFPTESPQEIDITIDEYIRFEDIVQPYPLFLIFQGENGGYASWGSKLKVGTWNRALMWRTVSPELYSQANMPTLKMNGKPTINAAGYPGFLVEKEMVFTIDVSWKLDSNPPKCILSPSFLEIPPSSLEYLGHIPDISGNGNYGYLHNFDIYSLIDEDGVLQFDGVDDYITFPNNPIIPCQMLMKCSWEKRDIPQVLYSNEYPDNHNFTLLISDDKSIAYTERNNGNTYIDGVLNKYLTNEDLAGLTHTITITNDYLMNLRLDPIVGCGINYDKNAKMKLHCLMLFDEISSDEDIVKLNEGIGIEGGYVESPSWYWDTFGKTNEDADKATIANIGNSVGDYDLQVKNVAFEGDSGYNGEVEIIGRNSLVLDGVDDYITNANVPVLTDYTYIFKRDILEGSEASSASMRKGATWQAGGGAFITDFLSSSSNQGFYSFGDSNILTNIPQQGTIYATKDTVNGEKVSVGTNEDLLGIDIGRWDSQKKMAFHKLMLWDRTIDNRSINMLRNMFDFDNIIDLNNPIFYI